MADLYRSPRNIVGMVGRAEELFQRLTQLPEVQAYLVERKKQIGGYVTIARADGVPLVTFVLGDLFLEKVEGCHKLSMEKAHRLGGYAAAPTSHRLSRQSANEKEEQYPGGIFGRRYIVSFSGLPADLDEIYSAALLCRLGDADSDTMKQLLAANGNRWISRIDFDALALA